MTTNKDFTIKGVSVHRLDDGIPRDQWDSHATAYDELQSKLPPKELPPEIESGVGRLAEIALILGERYDNELGFDTLEKVKGYLRISAIAEKEDNKNRIRGVGKLLKKHAKKQNDILNNPASINTKHRGQHHKDLDRYRPIYVAPLIVSSLLRILKHFYENSFESSTFTTGDKRERETHYIDEIVKAVKRTHLPVSQMIDEVKAFDITVRIAFLQYMFKNTDRYNVYATDIRRADVAIEETKRKFIKDEWPGVKDKFMSKYDLGVSYSSDSEEDVIDKIIDATLTSGLSKITWDSCTREERGIRLHQDKYLQYVHHNHMDCKPEQVGLDLIQMEDGHNVLHFYADLRYMFLRYHKGNEDGVVMKYWLEKPSEREWYLAAEHKIFETQDIAIYDEDVEIENPWRTSAVRIEFQYVSYELNPNWDINDPDSEPNQYIVTPMGGTEFASGYFTLDHLSRTNKDEDRVVKRVMVTTFNSVNFLKKIDFLDFYDVVT